jgi:hypothetical protein
MDLYELRLGANFLARHGLPDIAYPVAPELLNEALAGGGEMPLAALLQGLQRRSGSASEGWRALEGAMARLAELIAPEDDRDTVVAEGEDWWLEIGPADLAGRIVTIQREDCLLAAVGPRDDGRLRVAAYRPLDAKSAACLVAMSRKPHPVHGVSMRADNWEYALDHSAGFRQMYAAERGEAYLSLWENGLGIAHDGEVLADWFAQRALAPRRPAQIAIELGVHHARSDEP